jgi:hypothetical protein
MFELGFSLYLDMSRLRVRLLNSLLVHRPVMSRVNGETPRLPDTSCNSTFLKEVIHIFELQAFSLREEEKDYGDLVGVSIARYIRLKGQTHAKQKQAKMINVFQPILSIAVGVI